MNIDYIIQKHQHTTKINKNKTKQKNQKKNSNTSTHLIHPNPNKQLCIHTPITYTPPHTAPTPLTNYNLRILHQCYKFPN